MATYFSLILVIVTFVSGIIWALDKFIWAKARAEKVALATSQAELPAEAIAKLGQESIIVENAKSIFPVIAAVMILRSFIYEPFQIPSGSMMPTLLVGDFILVEKFAYGIKDPVLRKTIVETGKPVRGDVAVFKYPPQPTIDYIKRVVALPGDEVFYDRRTKNVYLNGEIVAQEAEGPYTGFHDDISPQGLNLKMEALGEDREPHMMLTHNGYDNRFEHVKLTVPEGHYFVMGDNRDHSADSRVWGLVPERNLVGEAKFIWMHWRIPHFFDGLKRIGSKIK